jgi:hypothetical protein
MTVPVVGGVTTAFDASSRTEHVINTPTHLENDAIYIAVVIDDALVLTAPAGFSAVLNNVAIVSTDQKATFSLFKAYAGASEPASYTVLSNSSERAVLAAWSVSAENGVNATANGEGTGALATCPTVTTTVDDCLLVRIVATDGETSPHSVATSDGYTSLALVEQFSAGTLSVQAVPFSTAGATGTLDVSLNSADEWLAVTLAIKPVDPTGDPTDPPTPPPTPPTDPDPPVALPGVMDDLIEQLRHDLGDAAAASWTDAELKAFLNSAIADYSIHFPMTRLIEVTSSATEFVALLPGDYVGISSVWAADTSYAGNTYLSRRDYRRPDFYDPPGHYDVINLRDRTRQNELHIAAAVGSLYKIYYLAYHPHDLLLDDYVTVPAHHWYLLRMYAVWMCSRKLQIAEQVSPTNTSALLMSQLSTNTRRLEESYVDALARALLGIEENPE